MSSTFHCWETTSSVLTLTRSEIQQCAFSLENDLLFEATVREDNSVILNTSMITQTAFSQHFCDICQTSGIAVSVILDVIDNLYLVLI